MKKAVLTTSVLALAGFFAFAGGVDTKSNQSTGYLRNPSRNTEDSRAEAALYNIAGTAFMDEGLFLNAGDQIIFKRYSNEYAGTEYVDKAVVYAFPNLEAVYRSGKLSFFGSFAVYGGGGKLEYDDGSAMTMGLLANGAKSAVEQATVFQTKATAATDTTTKAKYATNAQKYYAVAQGLKAAATDHDLSVYSAVFGEQIGIGFHFNDYVSAAAAVRILQGQQDIILSSDNSAFVSVNGKSDLGYRSRGWGYAFVIGVEEKPTDKIDLSAQYQTKATMKYEYTDVKGDLASLLGYEKGDSYKNDLPAVLNLGAGYQALDDLYLSTSFNLYFDSDAERNGNGTSLDYDNSWEIAVGAEYKVTDEIALSLGALYNRTGSNSGANNIVNPALDCMSAGAGAEFMVYKNVWLEGGFMYSYYSEKDYEGVTLNKRVPFMSLGVSFKPF